MTIPIKKMTKRGFVMTGGGAKGFFEAGVLNAFHLTSMEFDVITGSSIGSINSIIHAEYLLTRRILLAMLQERGSADKDIPKDLIGEIRNNPELVTGILAKIRAERESQKDLPSAIADDFDLEHEIKIINAMDDFIKTFHNVWFHLPSLNIIDDNEEGKNISPLAGLKNDLLRFGVSLPKIVRVAWYYTTPPRSRRRGKFRAYLAGGKLLWEVAERLKNLPKFLGLIIQGLSVGRKKTEKERLDEKQRIISEYMRTYLKRFGLERAVVGPDKAQELEDFFTKEYPVLRPEHLAEDYVPGSGNDRGKKMKIFDADRTLADFEAASIDVRLTRANFRTGHLEISAYRKPRDFAIYLAQHAWRLQALRKGFPLGSYRLQVPGNPNAIRAAMASGRYPGVLATYPVDDIYPENDPENELLYDFLNYWLDAEKVEPILTAAYEKFIKDKPNEAQLKGKWKIANWISDDKLEHIFPHINDSYVDGGSIDNTPSNAAIDAIREWAFLNGKSKRDVSLDLYVVLLHPESLIREVEARDPALYTVVKRTLEIAGAAKLTSDAATVSIINSFGRRGEYLAETLRIFLKAVDKLDGNQKAALLEEVHKIALEYKDKYGSRKPDHLRALLKKDANERLEKVNEWSKETLEERLPLNVEAVKIYPDKMPMDTLQFTERMGYRKENAIGMITMGCYNTMWDLRTYLEKKAQYQRDYQDHRALTLLEYWMDIEDWSKKRTEEEIDKLRSCWKCRRDACIFHKEHCRHGALQPDECKSDKKGA